MTQMRVQITTPYGVTTRTFSEDERLIVTNIHGDTFVGSIVLTDLLGHLPMTPREALAAVDADSRAVEGRIFTYDLVDVGEHEDVFALSWTSTFAGTSLLGLVIITGAYYDDDDYDLPDGVEFGEQYMYSLAGLPFEVVVEDVTGQLYDEVKAGEA